MILDLSNDTRDTIDGDGRVDPGWYLAELTDTGEDLESDRGGQFFEFTIKNGPFKGSSIRSKFSNPEYAESEKAAAGIIKLAKFYAARLGLIPETALGKSFEPNWVEAIGKKFAIQVENRPGKRRDGTETMYANLTYGGLFPLDHPKLPAAAKAALGIGGNPQNNTTSPVDISGF